MPMNEGTPLAQAQTLFGRDMVGPDEVGRVLEADPGALARQAPQLLTSVPYDMAELTAARARGARLMLRVPTDGQSPLTILRLHERFPGAIQERLMHGVGYQLRDEWTLLQEPFAQTTTCQLEWGLVHGAPLPATCNLSYAQQNDAIERYASANGLGGRLRRRSAVEAVYDTVLLAWARDLRSLDRQWDWTSTAAVDGSFIAVGDFAPDGMHLLGYSRAVRFGTLGVCAQHCPRA